MSCVGASGVAQVLWLSPRPLKLIRSPTGRPEATFRVVLLFRHSPAPSPCLARSLTHSLTLCLSHCAVSVAFLRRFGDFEILSSGPVNHSTPAAGSTPSSAHPVPSTRNLNRHTATRALRLILI